MYSIHRAARSLSPTLPHDAVPQDHEQKERLCDFPGTSAFSELSEQCMSYFRVVFVCYSGTVYFRTATRKHVYMQQNNYCPAFMKQRRSTASPAVLKPICHMSSSEADVTSRGCWHMSHNPSSRVSPAISRLGRSRKNCTSSRPRKLSLISLSHGMACACCDLVSCC